ncbi:hypothetical protein Nepgr_031122 [Nepenthes gracilis]|uniref:Uncharacterized protein n=1 Tax=Nepenthes gracilis TaxID=150966 RepID=A0AAD3Y6R6_NEPGR|nr:hypothetical protein Nepgr_031122 [Nepenthes gracilis]
MSEVRGIRLMIGSCEPASAMPQHPSSIGPQLASSAKVIGRWCTQLSSLATNSQQEAPLPTSHLIGNYHIDEQSLLTEFTIKRL